MLYTLAQAREAVKRFVDNGSCNVSAIDARVNEALERLIDNADFECMRATVRITVCNLSFTLPYNVEKLLHVTIDGTPAKIFGQAYQFLSSGVGDLDMRTVGSSFQDVMDQGEVPFQFDIPKCYTYNDVDIDVSATGLQLLALSTSAADVGKTIRIRGFGSGGTEVRAGVSPGIELPIMQWSGGVEGSLTGYWNININPSAEFFTQITEVIKPETSGYVTLYAVSGNNADPKAFFSFLAKYHPRQTIPQFRRYAITNKTVDSASSVLALVKMRYVPLVDAEDILPVDSLQAVKLMVMAIREENAGNLQGALNFESQAGAIMAKRERARTQSDGFPVILNQEHRTSLGRRMNRGINL